MEKRGDLNFPNFKKREHNESEEELSPNKRKQNTQTNEQKKETDVQTTVEEQKKLSKEEEISTNKQEQEIDLRNKETNEQSTNIDTDKEHRDKEKEEEEKVVPSTSSHSQILDTNQTEEMSRVEVSLQGNAWCNEGGAITHKGLSKWSCENAVCTTYVYISKPGSLQVSIKMNPKGHSVIQLTIQDESILLDAKSDAEKEFFVGEWKNIPKGYLAIHLQGIERNRQKFGVVSSLVLSGSCICPKTAFVKDNTDNFFYWGRRGPSVHLQYTVPKKDIEWFYSEVTVPPGSDVIGSYFMANGFSQGYFGIQVNSSTERRVLFSIWSPHQTDDPNKIPQDEKIKLLKKGNKVHTGEFGNEGSGGQSYLVYPWTSGQTYKFLLRAQPSESANTTTFTAYFSAKEDHSSAWTLIASFERPKICTYLKGLHSFLENFNPKNGDQERMALYDNQWVCDNSGLWTEITEVKLTGDNTARKKYRRDYSGGVKDDKFFLRNCGFFCEKTKLDSTFKRCPKKIQPQIIFGLLP